MGEQIIAFKCLSTFLIILFVVCLTVLTNCLLKAVAFCLGVIDGFTLKVITAFGCEGIFLPLR